MTTVYVVTGREDSISWVQGIFESEADAREETQRAQAADPRCAYYFDAFEVTPKIDHRLAFNEPETTGRRGLPPWAPFKLLPPYEGPYISVEDEQAALALVKSGMFIMAIKYLKNRMPVLSLHEGKLAVDLLKARGTIYA